MKKCVVYSEDEYRSINACLLRAKFAVDPLPNDYKKDEILRHLEEAMHAFTQEDKDNDT